MNHEPVTRMRKLIIAGTYAQYRDWLVLHKASSRAAVFIDSEEKLRGLPLDDYDIVLTGTYWDNPAYQTGGYLYYVHMQFERERLAS